MSRNRDRVVRKALQSSSVGIGANIAFFDLRAFDYVPDSARLMGIQGVDYAHEDLPSGQKRPRPPKICPT